jgi:hypothetical protein
MRFFARYADGVLLETAQSRRHEIRGENLFQ